MQIHHKIFYDRIYEEQEGFLQCQTPTSTLRLQVEVQSEEWKNGGM
jgi:hypothetical protein